MFHPQLTLIPGSTTRTARTVVPMLQIVDSPRRRRRAHVDPIRSLRTRRISLARLEDNVRTLLGTNPSFDDRPAKQRQTLAWVRSTSRRDQYAFENVCATLGLDARALRRRILRVASGLGIQP
jgi:hypothetical protein